MINREHLAWREDNIMGVLVMDIKAAFPTIARGMPIHAMKVKQIGGDLIGWTESLLSDRMVEMVIEGNVLQSRPMQAGIQEGSPMLPILVLMHCASLNKLVE